MTQVQTQQSTLQDVRNDKPNPELERLLKADVIVKRVDSKVLEAMGILERAVKLADAYQQLEALLDDATLAKLMRLMNSPLGFLTDRPAKPNKNDRGERPELQKEYPPAIVKRCLIEALLYGVMPIGNEFNIIGEKTYVTRQGLTRKLLEFPGLTDLRLDLGVPKNITNPGDNGPSGAVVHAKASWVLNGIEETLTCDIPVKMNWGMGADGVLGKAERKLRYRVYCRITGSTFTPEGEIDGDVPTPEKSTPESKAQDANAKILAAKEAAAKITPPFTPTPTPTPPTTTTTTPTKPLTETEMMERALSAAKPNDTKEIWEQEYPN